MQLKDHDQVSVAWGSRRGQRCLGFALVCVLTIALCLFGLPAFSTSGKTELQLDTLLYNGFSHYTSTPEAGAPSIPFRDNSVRKATDQPWFEQYWSEEDGAEA